MRHTLRDTNGRFRKARTHVQPRPLHTRGMATKFPQRLYGKAAHVHVGARREAVPVRDEHAEYVELMRAPNGARADDELTWTERESTLVRGGRKPAHTPGATRIRAIRVRTTNRNRK